MAIKIDLIVLIYNIYIHTAEQDVSGNAEFHSCSTPTHFASPLSVYPSGRPTPRHDVIDAL